MPRTAKLPPRNVDDSFKCPGVFSHGICSVVGYDLASAVSGAAVVSLPALCRSCPSLFLQSLASIAVRTASIQRFLAAAQELWARRKMREAGARMSELAAPNKWLDLDLVALQIKRHRLSPTAPSPDGVSDLLI